MKDLLKKYLSDDVKVDEFLNEMKANKFFLTREENLDKRYSKLQRDLDAKNLEHQQSLDSIKALEEQINANANVQAELEAYKTQVAELQANNQALAKENAVKIALLSNKAKPEDIDYLMFKLSKDSEAVKLDENGEISNINEVIDGLKTNYSSHFEVGAKKKVDVKDLGKGDGNNDVTVTKDEFNKMGYNARVQLKKDNPTLYEELSK